MKTLFSSLLAIIVLFSVCAPAHADNQGYPTTPVVLTLSSGTVAASGTAVITSQAFSPNAATGFAVVSNITVSGTANNTGNVTLNFQASLDGTNWTTTFPLTMTIAATGTTPAITYVNFPPNVAGGGATNIPWFRLGQVINANSGGTLTINSITISKSNR